MERDELKWLMSGYVATMIRSERKRQGLTLYKLSEISGVHVANLCKIEAGDTCPRIDTLQSICKALNIEIRLPISL